MKAADVFTKLDVQLHPDPSRTVIRPFSFSFPAAFDKQPTRVEEVADRVMALDPAVRDRMLQLLKEAMEARHRNVDGVFLRRFEEMKGDLGDCHVEGERDRLLLGAYFSQEYAFESAALFNPSIVSIRDQDPKDDSIEFILSLRGVGEGHISSVTFRTGTWDGGTDLVIHTPSPQGVPPRIESRRMAGCGCAPTTASTFPKPWSSQSCQVSAKASKICGWSALATMTAPRASSAPTLPSTGSMRAPRCYAASTSGRSRCVR